MKEYTFKIEQIIKVTAGSKEEALSLLPEYPYSPSPSWIVVDESIEEASK